MFVSVIGADLVFLAVRFRLIHSFRAICLDDNTAPTAQADGIDESAIVLLRAGFAELECFAFVDLDAATFQECIDLPRAGRMVDEQVRDRCDDAAGVDFQLRLELFGSARFSAVLNTGLEVDHFKDVVPGGNDFLRLQIFGVVESWHG